MQATTGVCPVDWTAVAPDWDAHRGHVETLKTQLTAALVDGLALAPGDRVLELGAGTGELAALLAGRVRPSGTVIASDVAPGMLELIRARTAASPGVEVTQIDACDIPLGDGSVDVVVFRMGLMLVSDPARAVAECRRVLAPGGRVAAAVWGAPQDNPWLTSVGMAAMMHGVVQGGPPTGPGGPFSLADPSVLQGLFADAGFADISVQQVDTLASFADADEHFDTVRCLAPPLAAALSAASDEARAAVRATLAGLVAQYRTEDGLRIPVRSLLTLARRDR